MIPATADTNIIVSAFLSRRGKPFELLSLALSGDVNLAVSRPMLDELADVLATGPLRQYSYREADGVPRIVKGNVEETISLLSKRKTTFVEPF